MLTRLYLKNFKSHRETDLKLTNLNIWAGQNGVGKSSALQSLLLLRQSHQKNRLNEGLDLNKPLCDIGVAKDALYLSAKEKMISFEIDTDIEQHLYWQFNLRDLESTFIEAVKSPQFVEFSNLSLFNDYFQYLSAARLPPQKSYLRDDYAVKQKRQLSLEKGQGELIAHFLHNYRQMPIAFSNLRHPQFKAVSVLLNQTAVWERELCPNITVHVREIGKSFKITYTLRTDNKTVKNEFSAENVGFGVTYALPIIVAVLSAEKDSLLLFENPEAHLHPHGQAKLAELIALAAHNGVQIILETHSDHIINGVLVAMKNYQTTGRGIAHDKVKIYQFDRDETTHATHAIEVPVLEGGRILRPPTGFFDQIEKDLQTLMGF